MINFTAAYILPSFIFFSVEHYISFDYSCNIYSQKSLLPAKKWVLMHFKAKAIIQRLKLEKNKKIV